MIDESGEILLIIELAPP